MKKVIKIELPVVIKKKGKTVIACCPILDVWTQGDTLDKAKKNIIEALRLFLLTCFEKGTLDAALRECKVPSQKKIISLPKNQEFIKVPIAFNVGKNCLPAVCHA
jgi:predicted RNase H-like HicB family nuclease